MAIVPLLACRSDGVLEFDTAFGGANKDASDLSSGVTPGDSTTATNVQCAHPVQVIHI